MCSIPKCRNKEIMCIYYHDYVLCESCFNKYSPKELKRLLKIEVSK